MVSGDDYTSSSLNHSRHSNPVYGAKENSVLAGKKELLYHKYNRFIHIFAYDHVLLVDFLH